MTHDAPYASPLHPVLALGLGMPSGSATADARTLLAHPAFLDADALVGGTAVLAAIAEIWPECFTRRLPPCLSVGRDISGLMRRIEDIRASGSRVLALCSGDPLFFGLGATLLRHFGQRAVTVIPGVSCLQAAAAVLGLPWQGLRCVSMHGRDNRFLPLAHALMARQPVCLLPDTAFSPHALAAWMRERGLTSFTLHVFGQLSGDAWGRINAQSHHTLRMDAPEASQGLEASEHATTPPGLILIIPDAPGAGMKNPEDGTPCLDAGNDILYQNSTAALLPFGIPDEDFAQERRLITKAPVRAAGLALLRIAPTHTIWDLGAGSGAVSVEAARLAYMGHVLAFERTRERVALIRENRRRFAAANLDILQAHLPDALPEHDGTSCPEDMPRPHAIFVGGGLGTSADTARETLRRAFAALRPGGRLLAHCVLLSSLELARHCLRELGASVSVTALQASFSAPLAQDCHLRAGNPVFLVLAEKHHGDDLCRKHHR